MGHVGATITATNRVLDLGGFPHLTKQEFFQLQGIMFALSFYPKFSVRDLLVQRRRTSAQIKVYRVNEPQQVHEVPPLCSPPQKYNVHGSHSMFTMRQQFVLESAAFSRRV